jgi:hypothetical protein
MSRRTSEFSPLPIGRPDRLGRPNIIGGLIAVIFLRSAWRLLRESWPAWRAAKAPAREFLQ